MINTARFTGLDFAYMNPATMKKDAQLLQLLLTLQHAGFQCVIIQQVATPIGIQTDVQIGCRKILTGCASGYSQITSDRN